MSLPSASELLKQSIVFYKKNYKILIGLGLLPSVFAVTSGLIFLAGGNGFILILLSGIVSICAFIINIVFPISTIKTIFEIDKGQSISDIKDVYKFAFGLFFSSLWLMILSTVIVMGGMLLLIIPGIILAITLSFGTTSLIVDDTRGLKALLTSYYYSRNKVVGIFGRMLFIALISMVFSILLFVVYFIISGIIGGSFNPIIVLHAISQPGSIVSIISTQIQPFIINCVFYPIFGIYSYLIYKNLKQQKPAPNPEVDFKKSKTWFKICSVISIVALVIAIVVIPVIVISTQISKVKSMNGSFTQSVQEDIVDEANDAR